MSSLLLGVNIDHVATLRNARGTNYPDPIMAALLAEQAGADGITVHLREDRRHIGDQDVRLLRTCIKTRLNLEIAPTPEMLAIACEVKPEFVCLVPERREEMTTECGLDVIRAQEQIKRAVARLQDAGIQVSLFVDPDKAQIESAKNTGANLIEIHTGEYAQASLNQKHQALTRIKQAAAFAHHIGLKVNAGHGLTYHNVQPVAAIPELYELNIGHVIIARALMTGIESAVREMKHVMAQGSIQSP